MNRTIFVGDLHGKYEVAEHILKNCPDDKIIFVGDYLDSFDRSIKDQVKTLLLVLDAAQAFPDRVIGLLGNHEYSYLNPQRYRCSGFRKAIWYQVKALLPDMRRYLLDVYTDPASGVVVTHAGITQVWIDSIEARLEEILDEESFGASQPDWNMVGQIRGGNDRCGGPVWCDYWSEFEPIAGIKQVFGHTAYRPVGKKRGVFTADGENFNVDCLDTSSEVLVWSSATGFCSVDYREF
ncbi:serine/threonine protein phosphatase [Allochromatium humboldtianum]|uniref:Serine/threonine protein phosphatase n=1 Tax=Allochromatium humboldtianum TaxID=504901 RepID=A0A850RD03_9GAMM|nr:metallophosphoesterase [Allochromatium humboldtianum]NVZ11218.1 serine/threonine protein phosphatase [Allochromatium humboldtianum]